LRTYGKGKSNERKTGKKTLFGGRILKEQCGSLKCGGWDIIQKREKKLLLIKRKLKKSGKKNVW